MRKKKTVSILLSAITLTAFFGCSRNNPAKTVETPSSAKYELSVTERAIEYVTQQLSGIKEGPSVFYEPLGFTESEITDSLLGNPFTIYIFDDTGQFSVNNTDTFVFPMLLDGDIIGIMEAAYLPDSGYDSGFSFTFGKSYSDELNSLSDQYKDDSLIIGNLNTRLLFATNGESVTVFKVNFGADTELSAEQVSNIIASVYASVKNPNYFRFPK